VNVPSAQLADALVPMHDTSLGPLADGLTLRQIGLSDRLCELDFEFPLAGGDLRTDSPDIRLADVGRLLAQHLPADDPLVSYVGRLTDAALGSQSLRGYLSGSLDVVLRIPDAAGGFAVLLDGRALRGPKGERVIVPTQALAQMIAEEWAGQGDHLELAAMQVTRLANTAIESIPHAREATAQAVADYAGSDLVCYYATEPEGLVAKQLEAWTPLLARAEAEAGLRFIRASGIIHQPQPRETLEAVRSLALSLDHFALTGLAFGAPLFGSAVLALSLHRGWITGEEAFSLSRIDEAWQESQWGVDAEAAERAAGLQVEAIMLERWFRGLDPA
jgi:chaperone required for assembly of F1-ATPase